MKITLCGSTRFIDEFNKWNVLLTEAGHIVYSVCRATTGEQQEIKPRTKQTLDLVHLIKIDESDAIVVLNKNCYIGESTCREIEWAFLRHKEIYWLECQVNEPSAWDLANRKYLDLVPLERSRP